nr:hypothetical protein [Actinomadura spongiicola]
MLPPPTITSWANSIDAQFGPLRTFVTGNPDHPNHTALAWDIYAYLRWRNAHARHPDVLAAQHRECTRNNHTGDVRTPRAA